MRRGRTVAAAGAVATVVLVAGCGLLSENSGDEAAPVPAPSLEGSPLPSPPGSTPPAQPAEPIAAAEPRTLTDERIDELSGLAASRLHPGVLFAINDSGGGPVVYAVGPAGDTVAALTLAGLQARDWEALAPGVDPDGTPVLWIGDIGDNRADQPSVRLVKIDEPASLVDQDVSYEVYPVRYPDGSHDAEALLVDPRDQTISIATKGAGAPGGLYTLDGAPTAAEINVLRRSQAVPSSVTDGAWELSAAAEPRLVLTDYLRLHRLEGAEWVSELAPLQLQREALAWPWLPGREDNDTVWLGSEGVRSRIITAEVP